ncbi:MAG TPA: outer membrane protein assembly factor BamD, partial [Pseudomonadales bacterium]|nr:outer membrane protein assembly factor BamD [Pseudomonadales bacterium]
VIGCSSTKEKEDIPQLSERQFYEEAQKALKGSNYTLAIERLQQLESRYPFGRYAEQAQLELIYANYKNMDYDGAGLAADRFIRLHPDHPEVDYAYYMKGVSSFSVDRGLLARFLPTEPAERDLTPAHQSFQDFSTFITRYPNSKYAPDARQRMIYLRNILAEAELHAAQWYMKRTAYLAAANRGRFVVENYPQTPAVPDALAVMVKAYRELKMEDLANNSLQVLKANFPNYPELNAQGDLNYEPSWKRAEEPSFLHKISFGLIG